MKISTIVLIRNAAATDFGGGERFPVFMADILSENNFEPVIISRSRRLLAFATDRHHKTIRGWWWPRQDWSSVKVLLFPVYLLWQILLTGWYVCVFLRLKPHAVHIQSKDDFIAATIAAKLLGKKAIWTDHADLKHVWLNLGIWYKNPVGKLVYFAAQFADHITVVSNSEQVLVSSHLSPNSPVRKKLRVVYNGVVDNTDMYPREQKTDDNHFTFCVASRLVVDKGIGEVITAFQNLLITHPHARLRMLGNGPDATLFHDQAGETQEIEWLGHQADPLNFMAKSDVFVHPTYHEGFSVALVEASMLGLPIIATAVGGNLEIISHEQTGLLVDSKNITSLQEAMVRLMNDPSLRAQLAHNARAQYEQRFNFETIVTNQFISLYGGES